MLLRRVLCTSAAAAEPVLAGQIAMVVGGVGPFGTGLARGLLRAGATVVVNSRHKKRLDVLSEELGHPEKLITINGSMLAPEAEKTVDIVLELTGGKLDHVVAHSAVRWWSKPGECDETNTMLVVPPGGFFDLTTDEFAAAATALPRLHFEACRLLLPKLTDGSSYTFVTGGEPVHLKLSNGVWQRVSSGEQTSGVGARSSLGQVNAQAVWGLAAAVRREMAEQPVTVAEVRVNMRFNRPLAERLEEPRGSPLSHDVGAICAGIASQPQHAGGLHVIDSAGSIEELKARFPSVDQPYAVYFRSPDLL